MGLDASGFDQIKLTLRRLGEVAERAAFEELKHVGEELRETAQHMAPIDYGDLKDAIKMRVIGDLRDARGRFVKGGSTVEIYIDNNHPVHEAKHGVDTVGEYAWIVHQYMGYGSVQGALDNGRPFNPSDKSVAEGAKHGVEAGGRFLERAAELMAQTATARMAKIVQKHIEAIDFEI